jgi:hypothetical protein
VNFLQEYRNHLLEKKPQQPRVQYFWLALSCGIVVFALVNFAEASAVRSVALVVIALSIAIDAVTNLSYYKNRPLFERLVNVKIAANILSLAAILAFIVLWYKFKM